MKWFKHYSIASDDEFIARLEAEFGLEGYARWWKLLEVIAKQMDGTERCHAEYPVRKWMEFLSCKQEKIIKTFLNFCQNFGKLSTNYEGNILKITCPKLLELRDEHTRKLRSSSGQTPVQDLDTELDTDTVLLSAGAFEKIYTAGSAVFPNLAVANTSSIHQWIAAGCDPDLDAVPEIKRHAGKQIKSWSYFTGVIMDAKATRTTPPPEGKPHATSGRHYAQGPSKSERARAAITESNKQLGYADRPPGGET